MKELRSTLPELARFESDQPASARRSIDLVISDVVMPDMGGVELHKRLAEEYPNLKVILTSGYSEVEVRGDIRHLRAAFLRKPFTAQSLIRWRQRRPGACVSRRLTVAQ